MKSKLFNPHRTETFPLFADNVIDVASEAFICRREKWNYNKVKWKSNDLVGFAYPRSRYTTPSAASSNYRVLSLNFVLHHFLAAIVSAFFSACPCIFPAFLY